jgi:hypothetical protein
MTFMQLFFMGLLLVLTFNAQAASLKCTIDSADQKGSRHGGFVADMLVTECHSKRGEVLYAYMHSAGASMHFTKHSQITITCPGLSLAELPGKYYGVKLVAGAQGKLGFSAVAGKSGLCMVGMTEAGAGISLTLGRLLLSNHAIYRYYPHSH